MSLHSSYLCCVCLISTSLVLRGHVTCEHGSCPPLSNGLLLEVPWYGMRFLQGKLRRFFPNPTRRVGQHFPLFRSKPHVQSSARGQVASIARKCGKHWSCIFHSCSQNVLLPPGIAGAAAMSVLRPGRVATWFRAFE